MEKIRPLWRIIIGFFLFSWWVYVSNEMIMQLVSYFVWVFWTAAFATWIYLCFRVKYVDPARALLELELEKKSAREAEQRRIREEREAEEARRKAAQAEFERTHGRMEFNIAGVTFKNDDGSKRQDLLKEALASDCDGGLSFEEYEYNGKPAVRIIYDDVHILGNVPARMVSEFLNIVDKITSVNLDIKTFTPEDVDDDWDDGPVRKNRERLYRAKVHIVYDKAPD